MNPEQRDFHRFGRLTGTTRRHRPRRDRRLLRHPYRRGHRYPRRRAGPPAWARRSPQTSPKPHWRSHTGWEPYSCRWRNPRTLTSTHRRLPRSTGGHPFGATASVSNRAMTATSHAATPDVEQPTGSTPSAARPAPRTVARIQETAGELRESRVVGSANGDVEAFLRDHACHPTGCGDGTGVIRGFASAILPPSLNRVSGGDRLSSPACDVRPDGIQKAERYRAHRADSRRPRKRTSPVANRLFTPLKTTTASVVSRPFPPRSDSRCSPTPASDSLIDGRRQPRDGHHGRLAPWMPPARGCGRVWADNTAKPKPPTVL